MPYQKIFTKPLHLASMLHENTPLRVSDPIMLMQSQTWRRIARSMGCVEYQIVLFRVQHSRFHWTRNGSPTEALHTQYHDHLVKLTVGFEANQWAPQSQDELDGICHMKMMKFCYANACEEEIRCSHSFQIFTCKTSRAGHDSKTISNVMGATIFCFELSRIGFSVQCTPVKE